MIHRIPAEATVGIENVPFDEESLLLRFRQALEFGERCLHTLMEFLPAELVEGASVIIGTVNTGATAGAGAGGARPPGGATGPRMPF